MAKHEIKTVHFTHRGNELVAEVAGSYGDGTPTIQVRDVHTGEAYATLTTCMPGAEVLLGPGDFLVKGWSENEAMVAFLTGSGLLVEAGTSMFNGFVTAQVCKWA